ncbi:hypothetical protein EXU10_21310 [Klebsiella quasipneumoniae subsp. similipneumoniae]|nr:hypothetical protein EXT88_23935 [Klebsiella quasipneumoniae subsp. similipneumoniae]TBO86481.1 hypothetical protein EXU03_26120 [Klebsiella quasipneumoniae subsp. similipneumoniae]TBO93769.1 hypothetical protein EXU08_22155 [Klebsiella quasipneumoniae subsp. similipneumoniae]TBO97169.1 hypothetical protein EXU20_23995 [Klebsiella quasipneumoniae subsp. similipneumoniae]TBP03398.1 hypothetical protein EXT90_24205 [Klebsiella quasipneumoniae subsp. similipneumoniae]
MGSCAAPSAKGDDKFITTDYLQQCQPPSTKETSCRGTASATSGSAALTRTRNASWNKPR